MAADYTNPASEPWWTEVDTAPRCSCGTRLEKVPGTSRLYPCPFGCEEARDA